MLLDIKVARGLFLLSFSYCMIYANAIYLNLFLVTSWQIESITTWSCCSSIKSVRGHLWTSFESSYWIFRNLSKYFFIDLLTLLQTKWKCANSTKETFLHIYIPNLTLSKRNLTLSKRNLTPPSWALLAGLLWNIFALFQQSQ